MLAALAVLTSFYSVPVTRVVDGDTIRVQIPNVPEVFSDMSVRLAAIDTPEMNATRVCERRDAKKAKAFLEILIKSKSVDLIDCEGDKYWRLNCRVVSGGKDLGSQLSSAGLAYHYMGAKKIRWACI